MDIFEPGIQSGYSTHQFKEGEQGMKCCSCPRVMTIAEWKEKRKCFCQNTNAVLAVARSSAPTRLQTRNNSLNHQNTRVNTSSTTARNTNTNLNVTPASISRSSTSPSRSSSTSYSSSSNSRERSSLPGWIGAAMIALFLGLGVWQSQSNQALFFKNNIEQNSDSTQNSPPQLDPKEVITQYYQLAPSNKTAALALLSDPYKELYKKYNQGNDKSFWNTIQSVKVYAILTLSSSNTKHQIKVWLEYLTIDGYTACESQVVDVILDPSKNQWLIDQTGEVEQKLYCEN